MPNGVPLSDDVQRLGPEVNDAIVTRNALSEEYIAHVRKSTAARRFRAMLNEKSLRRSGQ